MASLPSPSARSAAMDAASAQGRDAARREAKRANSFRWETLRRRAMEEAEKLLESDREDTRLAMAKSILAKPDATETGTETVTVRRTSFVALLGPGAAQAKPGARAGGAENREGETERGAGESGGLREGSGVFTIDPANRPQAALRSDMAPSSPFAPPVAPRLETGPRGPSRGPGPAADRAQEVDRSIDASALPPSPPPEVPPKVAARPALPQIPRPRRYRFRGAKSADAVAVGAARAALAASGSVEALPPRPSEGGSAGEAPGRSGDLEVEASRVVEVPQDSMAAMLARLAGSDLARRAGIVVVQQEVVEERTTGGGGASSGSEEEEDAAASE
jgi:hypothetical protein